MHTLPTKGLIDVAITGNLRFFTNALQIWEIYIHLNPHFQGLETQWLHYEFIICIPDLYLPAYKTNLFDVIYFHKSHIFHKSRIQLVDGVSKSNIKFTNEGSCGKLIFQKSCLQVHRQTFNTFLSILLFKKTLQKVL